MKKNLKVWRKRTEDANNKPVYQFIWVKIQLPSTVKTEWHEKTKPKTRTIVLTTYAIEKTMRTWRILWYYRTKLKLSNTPNKYRHKAWLFQERGSKYQKEHKIDAKEEKVKVSDQLL